MKGENRDFWFLQKKKDGEKDIPLPSRQRNGLDEIPQFAPRHNRPRLVIALRRPLRRKLNASLLLGIFAFSEHDDTFFLEELEGVFEGFFIDSFEV